MRAPDRSLLAASPAVSSDDAVAARGGPDDVLAALRQRTQAIHAQLDAGLPLAREDATLPDYQAHLMAVGGWLARLSPVLAVAGGPAATASRQSARLQAIDDDLHDAGADAAATPTADGPNEADAFAALQDDARHRPAVAWGAAYVIEGSQLGGRMLQRKLAATLAPHPLRYLGGQGLPPTWASFTADLRATVAHPDAIVAACDGAVATFGLLVRRFERLGALA